MAIFGKPMNFDNNFDDDFELSKIRLDLAEDDDYYYIYIDAPGKENSDIKMKFKGNNLSVKFIAESDDKNLIADKECIVEERIHDETERLIGFDTPIDKKSVSAKLTDGILYVIIQKIDPDKDDEQDLISIN